MFGPVGRLFDRSVHKGTSSTSYCLVLRDRTITAEELGKCGVFMCPGGGREENRFSEHLGFPCRASVVALSMDGGAW